LVHNVDGWDSVFAIQNTDVFAMMFCSFVSFVDLRIRFDFELVVHIAVAGDGLGDRHDAGFLRLRY
jgi:hypothetical protein